MKPRPIELLAPAKNLECGLAAIDHGADAVYIGGPSFGARAAAGNSLADIKTLVDYAHIFNVKVYVTVNTILKEEELPEVEQLIWKLYAIGVDALIVQDMALFEMNLPPIPLHASTQMDNRTVEKVRFEAEAGCQQIVLARELSLEQIKEIHEAVPDVSLEAFIHGALCVSFSGQCYVSEACFHRSANRGECAQFCRLAFDMVDADNKVILHDKHALSMRDLNQSNELEAIIDAGVSSLKIEGRLKDVDYVKNVTAYYRRKLDELFKRRREYIRSSVGTLHLTFEPQLDKSFNRGFTHYFLKGKGEKDTVSSMDTPKSMGEEMGRVKEVRSNYLTVAGLKHFNNGDGICYLDENDKLQGFRVNRVESNKLYPQEMPALKPNTILYRNYDRAFDKVLAGKSAERKIGVDIFFEENRFGFALTLTDEEGRHVTLLMEQQKEPARTPQNENISKQLCKLGNTPFEMRNIELRLSDNWFIPSSLLADLRRRAVEELLKVRRINYHQHIYRIEQTHHPFVTNQLTYLGNVMNEKAAQFYREHGVNRIAPAFERKHVENVPLMFCKHCLKFSMGWCTNRQHEHSPFKEPYYLVSGDGHRFRLEFDCKHCQMKVYESD